MDNVVRDFYNKQSEEQRKKAQKIVDATSSEQVQINKLTVSGRYLMEVPTFAFIDKQTKEMRHSPEVICSAKTKSLILVINLRVVDGTPAVPAGSSIFANITISPAAGATEDKLRKTISLMKPRISALTGTDNISLEPEWIEEYLVPTFESKDGKFKLIKDHKMKKRVMVTVEDSIYKEKEVLNVTSIVKAVEGDKSVSNSAQKVTHSNVAAPPSDDHDDGTDVSSGNIIDDSIPEETVIPHIADVAQVEDFPD